MNLSYLIIGAGGTGGCIGGYLRNSNKEITLIARGKHLEAMRKNGLLINTYGSDKDILIKDVKACTQEDYKDKADVIFICTKGYSLDGIMSLIEKASKDNTVVVPILNVYGTGEKVQREFPKLEVLDGCMYIASEISEPGVIRQNGKIFTVVFGRRDGEVNESILKQIENDLKESSITAILSSNIKLDTFRKFSYVSPQGAVGSFYNVTAGDIQSKPEIRNAFIQCVEETKKVGSAMGIELEDDTVKNNLNILDSLPKDMTTSMQRDLIRGGQSEVDGLVFEVVRLGRKYNVQVPMYEKIARKLGVKAL
ncbi:MAG: 2-dehydropantoate 2-reductase [Clostridium sp.]|nr:2-dehydropantoate 2-reductase [Clostridium sp.]